MRIIKEHIFPTVLHVADNVLEPEYIDSMIEDILKGKRETETGGWQSNSNLMTNKKYKALTDKIHEVTKYIFKDLKFIYDDYFITDMWSNVLVKNEFHKPHTHSNNVLSGVYYLQNGTTNDNKIASKADIQFYDPRPQADIITPNFTQLTKDNAHVWFFPSLVNRMILFPSWLQHYVPVNYSDTPRISIAFNVMLKGKSGAQYQSSEF